MDNEQIEQLIELTQLFISEFGKRDVNDDDELLNEENQNWTTKVAMEHLVNLEKLEIMELEQTVETV